MIHELRTYTLPLTVWIRRHERPGSGRGANPVVSGQRSGHTTAVYEYKIETSKNEIAEIKRALRNRNVVCGPSARNCADTTKPQFADLRGRQRDGRYRQRLCRSSHS